MIRRRIRANLRPRRSGPGCRDDGLGPPEGGGRPWGLRSRSTRGRVADMGGGFPGGGAEVGQGGPPRGGRLDPGGRGRRETPPGGGGWHTLGCSWRAVSAPGWGPWHLGGVSRPGCRASTGQALRHSGYIVLTPIGLPGGPAAGPVIPSPYSTGWGLSRDKDFGRTRADCPGWGPIPGLVRDPGFGLRVSRRRTGLAATIRPLSQGSAAGSLQTVAPYLTKATQPGPQVPYTGISRPSGPTRSSATRRPGIGSGRTARPSGTSCSWPASGSGTSRWQWPSAAATRRRGLCMPTPSRASRRGSTAGDGSGRPQSFRATRPGGYRYPERPSAYRTEACNMRPQRRPEASTSDSRPGCRALHPGDAPHRCVIEGPLCRARQAPEAECLNCSCCRARRRTACRETGGAPASPGSRRQRRRNDDLRKRPSKATRPGSTASPDLNSFAHEPAMTTRRGP